MITANDLKGIMAMMPAFTTKDGDQPDAEDTVNTTELARAGTIGEETGVMERWSFGVLV